MLKKYPEKERKREIDSERRHTYIHTYRQTHTCIQTHKYIDQEKG